MVEVENFNIMSVSSYIFRFFFLFVSLEFVIYSGKHSNKKVEQPVKNKNKIKKGGVEPIKEDATSIIKKLLGLSNDKDGKQEMVITHRKINKNSSRVLDINEIKNRDKLYVENQNKYDSRSALNIRERDIVDGYILEINKNITLSANSLFNDNNYFIASIFDGIKRGILNAYADVLLEKRIEIDEIKKRMKKPVILDTRRRKRRVNSEGFFNYSDIDNVEIIGNVFFTGLSSNVIVDFVAVRLYIPASISKLDNDIAVCYLNYNDLLDYFRKNRSEEKFKFPEGVTCIADAIENDKFNVIYDKIEGNNFERVFNKNNVEENRMSVEKTLTEIKCGFYRG